MKYLMLLQLTEGPPLPHRSVLVVAIPHVIYRKLRLHHRVNFVGSDFGLKMSFEPDKICDSDIFHVINAAKFNMHVLYSVVLF